MPSTSEIGGVGGDSLAVHHQQRNQLDRSTDLGVDPVDLQDVADGHLVLAAATAHDRVHA